MAISTFSALRVAALQVRNEHTDRANTAVRVGDLSGSSNDTAEATATGVDPRQYGAAGTGLVDDRVALLAAIDAAIAINKPVVGGGKTYGIAGNLTLVSNAWLRDVKCKQLTPAAVGDVRTLTSNSANNIRLERVTVDRNGNGTNGAVTSDSGIWIQGGSGHLLVDVEVFGNDIGVGIVMWGCSDSSVVRPYVHDINYSLGADPGDDRVMGIWSVFCTNYRLIDPIVKTLGGNYGSGQTTQWSRGVTFSGCTGYTLVNPIVHDVDQGVDTTGSDGNVRFTYTGGVVSDCRSWGYKFANSARDGAVTGAVAIRCGYAGFVVSGPGEAGLTVKSAEVTFENCSAYDTASNGVYAGSNNGGFLVFPGAFDTDYPKGVKFSNCKAIDRQAVPTMKYGFRNDVTAATDGRYNEAVDCRSIGHTVAAFSGMNQGRVDLGLSGAFAIGTGSWTLLPWTTETDLGAMYDSVGAPGRIFARRDGDFQIAVGVTFAANATGQRGIRLIGNGGTVILGTTTLVNTASVGVTNLCATWCKKMAVGDELRVEVWQSSGGNLDAQTPSAAVVEQVG
jgi:hypothetical protein